MAKISFEFDPVEDRYEVEMHKRAEDMYKALVDISMAVQHHQKYDPSDENNVFDKIYDALKVIEGIE